MKADPSGTFTEQMRHEQGWYPSHKRPRCDSCLHSEIKETATGVSAKCLFGKFSTSPAACCKKYEANKR